ncbi:MAG TPA: type VI secretion system contractile sheath small subunit [Pyrinomonadaceae bacterium]|nr:type VI secretion system contractile sheath small subunit [Pyrinomonadaceae bacterium]
MPESIQHKLDRVRRPRVQITYDVETLGSIVKTELPFVVGIMADLSGYERRAGETNPKALKDRKFIEIDRDNFDEIMKKLLPTATLKQEGFTDTLTFESLDSFEPKNVLDKIPALRGKFESRTRLSNLVAKLDGNPQLQKELVEALANLSQPDKDMIRAHIVAMRGDGAQIAAARFDADALVANLTDAQKKVLKAYIVEHYPDTTTPDVATLATKITDDEKTAVKAEILEKYGYAVTADAAALAAGITDDAQKTELLTYVKTQYPAASGAADLAAAVALLDAGQKNELKGHILKKYPAAVTDDLAALVSRLGDADQDKVKAYIEANAEVDAVLKPVTSGVLKLDVTVMMKSLKAHEKKELEAYIKATYPPPAAPDNTEGGQPQ